MRYCNRQHDEQYKEEVNPADHSTPPAFSPVGKYFQCTFHVSSRTHPPALIVTIGAPSLPPVSVRVIANIRNEKSFFDW